MSRLVESLPASEQMSPMRAVFEREICRRGARDACFAPLSPFVSPGHGVAQARLPSDAAAAFWEAGEALFPSLCKDLTNSWSVGDGQAVASSSDDLCRRLARALKRSDSPEAGALSDRLSGAAAEPETAAILLALTPVIRSATPRLPTWTFKLTAKSAAELRTAFSEAAGLSEDAGPLFIEATSGHLDEPCHVLRLISLILDQPTDQFLASSPLGCMAERLIVQAEQNVERVRAFSPGEGGATEVGAGVMTAAAILLEFEQWVEVGRAGPWGARLAALRRSLAVEVEARLRATPRIMADCLPTRSARWTQRSAVRTPRLGRDPEPVAVARAEDQAAFLAAIRRSPSTSGFAALLAKTCADLDDQLDSYVEGLLDLLHRASEEERPRLQAYLEVSARLTERYGGEPAGRIVRRRAAAA